MSAVFWFSWIYFLKLGQEVYISEPCKTFVRPRTMHWTGGAHYLGVTE